MQRRFKISVDGHAYDVLVEEIVTGPGNLYPDRGTMATAPTAPDSAPAAAPAAPTTANPPAAGPGDVVSPMAGVVISIDVAVGDKVTKGMQVLSLEAMKTKTVVTAGRAGTVEVIAATPGQSVEAGQLLLRIA